MKKTALETGVGLFVVFGLLCTAYLTIKLGKMELLGSNYYTLKANFRTVAGLKTGANVEIAGVQVGTVEKISLDSKTHTAITDLKIDKSVKLSADVIASIKTSGLIGDKYIQLSPGGDPDILKNGEMITETESPIDFEELISKYVFGSVQSKDTEMEDFLQ
ncbi:MAG: outer membrane lipid asymmetry maintenance protein MlaD [Desulfobacteraceae bacterium]|nr:outer membrane lipid asymmetry maintenance protein MlaD [Desulfobacteraceae bacterium]